MTSVCSARRRQVMLTGCACLAIGYLSPDSLVSDHIEARSDRTSVRFEFEAPDTAPFPSDLFTVADATHNTGRRMNLPYPDCAVQVSDCEDLNVINELDGFGLQTRISIPFDGPIDPSTVASDAIFVISRDDTLPGGAPGGEITGINQAVWDPATLSLHVEVDQLLRQHTRYALIVTHGLRDPNGKTIKASEEFRHFRTLVAPWYRDLLEEAIAASTLIGVPEEEIAAASVFTTQSITSPMERIRDEIKSGTPAPANFLVGLAGERAVYDVATTAAVTWHRQTVVSPPAFTTSAVNVTNLKYLPGAVGQIAFGTYESPEYRVTGEYIPAVGTLTGAPAVQSYQTVSFVLALPAGAPPAQGWPVAFLGHGQNGNAFNTFQVAAMLASRGIASIGIHLAGNGFGPLSFANIQFTNGTSRSVSIVGRGVDQNGDNQIGQTEGATARHPRRWTVGERDSSRQTVADLMQLVRVIEVGVDVDGDGAADLDPHRIYYYGISAGGMYGSMFTALEPAIAAFVPAVPGGMSPEHGRWASVGRRAEVIGAGLQARIPSLINSPGITEIEGVAIAAPHFNENKPLRDQPAVTNTIVGALEIQAAMEIHEWGQQSGQSPIPWVRHLREEPLPGNSPKPMILQFAKADQNAINPGTSALLRAGNLAAHTLHYRHDLAWASDTAMPKNPHVFFPGTPAGTNATVNAVVRGAQDQAAEFFASHGTVVIHPQPAQFFEVPLAGPLPETLDYIP
jgi:hypothetical protein